MENLFGETSSSDEAQGSCVENARDHTSIPEFKLEPAAVTADDTVFDDDGIDLCSPGALLDVAESNPSVLLPTVLPGPREDSSFQSTPLEFFSTPGTHFMHIQMPSALPHLDKERTLQSDQQGVQASFNTRSTLSTTQEDAIGMPEEPLIYQTSRMSCLPSGRIGKIRIHKSGKIKLHVGDHVFNFAPGNKVSCKQQVGCLLEENDEFLFLGNYHKKFVVSPDYLDMLRHQ